MLVDVDVSTRPEVICVLQAYLDVEQIVRSVWVCR